MNKRGKCFECGGHSDHDHHVVPQSIGGTATVPLCASCHGKIHGLRSMTTSKLTSVAMQQKKSMGERVGAVPYGYTLSADGVRLVAVAAEQAVIAEARAMRAAGLSLRAVSQSLDSRGMRARNGKPFVAAQVARMVAGVIRGVKK